MRTMLVKRTSVAPRMRAAALAAAALLAVALLASCSCSAARTEPDAQPQEEASAQKAFDGAAVSDAPEPERPAPEPEYILIIGDDAWENYTPGHADLMMLMRLDFERGQIALVTVPRDTKHVFADGHADKLNQVYTSSGPEAQCAAVSEVTGVEVTQYVVVGFDGFQNIIGHFGGLDVNLPYALDYSFYTKDHPNEVFAAGEQTLTPWRAMALSRTRTSYGDYGLEQDMMRQTINRQMMVGLIRLAFSDPAQTGALLSALQGFVSTNVPLETQTAWAEELASGTQITVHATTGPFTGGIDDEAGGLWLVTPDEQGWASLMAAIEAGQDPSEAAAAYSAELESPLAPVSTVATVSLG
ncbi:LCP family protein [Rubneribacter sp.]